MRCSRGIAALALLALASACASAPEPAPEIPAGIAVTPIERGRTFGGEAVYAVAAPLDLVVREILDFPAQAAYRPTVLEARSMEAGENGGTVAFRFRGALGYEPEATCAYTVERTEGAVAIRYEMTSPSLALWLLRGGFALSSIDAAHTRIRQDFQVSALVMDQARLLDDLRRDAKAIADHLEAKAAGR
ncbi:MAG: hypothetical protein MUE73_06380 [Planctomycetes bacterium]|jgi:hypothetical protein|nr:hypothetical protein [Planctomycetota bacterium]